MISLKTICRVGEKEIEQSLDISDLSKLSAEERARLFHLIEKRFEQKVESNHEQ